MRPRLLDLFCCAGGAAMGTDLERAWAAGFFDGEGCVSPYQDKRPGRRPGISLSIEQVDPRPLRRFAAAVGWSGRICRRPQRRAANRQITHRIYATNGRAIAIVAAIWPFLSEPKQEQFERAIALVGEDRYAPETA